MMPPSAAKVAARVSPMETPMRAASTGRQQRSASPHGLAVRPLAAPLARGIAGAGRLDLDHLGPEIGKPLARLHHTAVSGPGNSGGPLVNGAGKLVGIVASGGDGRFEAIPATEIVKLKARSGAEYRVISDRIGMAYRMCTETLEAANASNRRLAFSCMAFLAAQCTSSGNRQLMDLAGQVFAGQRHFDRAIAMFERALDQDSNAINTLVSMAIALHLDRRYEDETSHLRRLLDILPADPQVLRLAIQAGTWGGDKELAERAFGLLTQHHPQMALAARGFLDRPSAPPR